MTSDKTARREAPEALEVKDLERAGGGTLPHEPVTMKVGGPDERRRRFLDHDFGLNE